MLALPASRASGIARGVGGAAARQTKTHTSGPAPIERSGFRAADMGWQKGPAPPGGLGGAGPAVRSHHQVRPAPDQCGAPPNPAEQQDGPRLGHRRGSIMRPRNRWCRTERVDRTATEITDQPVARQAAEAAGPGRRAPWRGRSVIAHAGIALAVRVGSLCIATIYARPDRLFREAGATFSLRRPGIIHATVSLFNGQSPRAAGVHT